MRKYEELVLEVKMLEENDIVTTSGRNEVEDAIIFGDIFE